MLLAIDTLCRFYKVALLGRRVKDLTCHLKKEWYYEHKIDLQHAPYEPFEELLQHIYFEKHVYIALAVETMRKLVFGLEEKQSLTLSLRREKPIDVNQHVFSYWIDIDDVGWVLKVQKQILHTYQDITLFRYVIKTENENKDQRLKKR